MSSLRRGSLATALCATVAASIAPSSSFAGVMSVTDKASISVSTPTDRVDWRAYPHRHHRWHTGWYYGWPRYRLGTAYGSAAPFATYGAAYPWYGAYGAAYPSCDCGTSGYAGDGWYGGVGLGAGTF